MWPIGKVIPIHKKGNTRKVENKRPISLLTTFCKIFEKALYNRLYHYIETSNILTSSQHGFRVIHSTESAIMQFVNPIYQSLEKRHHHFAICIDFTKAFDCLNHRILIAKLDNNCIRGPTLALIEDYLRGRTQIVYYND